MRAAALHPRWDLFRSAAQKQVKINFSKWATILYCQRMQRQEGNTTMYTYEAVKNMTFAGLGAIEDPTELMGTGFASPLVVRYIVRTGQLQERYPSISLIDLLEAIQAAGAAWEFKSSEMQQHWVYKLSQLVQAGVRNPVVDEYLDSIGPLIREALAKA